MSFYRRAIAALLCALGLLAGAGAQAATPTVRPVELRTEFQVDPVGIATARPVFGWTLQATAPRARGLRQVAYRLRVASSLATLQGTQPDVWDSGRVVDAQYWQRTYEGPPLAPHRSYWWQVQSWTAEGAAPGPWSAPARFTTALLEGFDPSARWIAAEADGPPSRPALESEAGQRLAEPPPPLPVFRKTFSLAKPVAQALLFVVGLGQAEVTLNGRPVTDAVMQPGWTDYRKTVLYNSYDVSPLLRRGRNAFGALLGNGMYQVQGVRDRYTKFVGSYGQPKLLLQLELRYADGSRERIVSDASWQTRPGPVQFSSIFGGEDVDARSLPPDWDQPGFVHGTDWQPATLVAGPGGVLAADTSAPMAVIEHLPALRITHPKPGVTVYDLGRTVSGWPTVTVSGPAGSRVTLLPGELLAADGTVTQRSVAATPQAPVKFSYTLRGAGREAWHPRFSYTSLRYVQVMTEAPDGAPQPALLALGGDVVHARVDEAGRFDTSDALYGRIHRLIDAAVRSNLASIVTDCPSREKLGWLEVTHLNAATLMFKHDVTPIYEKMANDMADAQQADGLVPSIAPEFITFVDGNGRSTPFRDSPEWGSALILSPWALFQFTGNDRPLRRHYAAMQRYLDHLARGATEGLARGGLGDWYDIGPKPPGESQLTDRRLTATGVYYQALTTMVRIAERLDKAADAAGYAERAAAVREAYNAAFFDAASGRYDRGSQTAQAMSLALGLVPAGQERAVLRRLVDDIEAHTDHITTGDIGFHYLVRALTDHGRSDVLARILSRTDAPSYGAQLAQGATTLTEAWDANPASSQNHFMLGHAQAWFYRGLAGLSFDMAEGPDAAIRLRPSFLPGVASASASYRSPLGEVALAWRRDEKTATVRVDVPAGASAQLELAAACDWSESGHAIDRAAGDRLTLTLGSGRYDYTTRSPACTTGAAL